MIEPLPPPKRAVATQTEVRVESLLENVPGFPRLFKAICPITRLCFDLVTAITAKAMKWSLIHCNSTTSGSAFPLRRGIFREWHKIISPRHPFIKSDPAIAFRFECSNHSLSRVSNIESRHVKSRNRHFSSSEDM